MATANRMPRAVRWLAGAGLLAFPACATPDPGPPVRLLPGAAQATSRMPAPAAPGRPARAESPVVPASATVALPAAPAAAAQGKPLPITLPTALALSDASPLDIQIAGERLRAASAALDRANVLWLPNVNLGVDYFRHDGQIQDVAGTVFTTSKSSLFLGAGPQVVFPVSDALFAPLAARQGVRARLADVQAARNDTVLRVAEAYFTVQQARGEVAGAIDALRRAEELVALTGRAVPDFTPAVEVNRAKAEAARRRQAVEAAYERWQVASADLTRLLRLEPGTLVEPAEEPALTVSLLDPATPPEELVPLALTYRPELAADQAVIQAALARVRQEKVRPYVPTVAVRGVGSQTPGLAGGYFGGGLNDFMGNFGARFSVDIQAVWELQNLGLGNRAARREREAESREALLRLLRTQDLVTAEVVQAHARVRRAANRLKAAEDGAANAVETADKSLKGLAPGKRGPGGELVLLVRPQEAVAAVAALDQAYRDYYAAVADHNRAQFQLYRALGHPADCLPNVSTPGSLSAREGEAPAEPSSRRLDRLPQSESAAGLRPAARQEPRPPEEGSPIRGPAPDPPPVWRPAATGPRPSAPVPVSVHPAGR